MEKLILLTCILSYFFVSGKMEGYWKLKNTANHRLSIIQVFLLMIILYTVSNYVILTWYNITAVPFLRKVPFDYGYMYGSKSKNLLGTTSWDDILINKLNEKFGKRFPVDVLVLFLLLITGVSLIIL